MNKPFWELLQITDENPEYKLFESVISEFTWISGWPIYYYRKIHSDGLDKIYGEDTTSEYSQAYETKLIYEPTEETNILDSFGITSDEVIQYMQIPKSIFKEDVSDKYTYDNALLENIIPAVGDCIRTLWNDKIYQIIDLGSEQKIFQGRKMIWEFITKPYIHSEESDSAQEMLYDNPNEDDFYDGNVFTETKELSAYGDNKSIEKESDPNPDSQIYGY